MKKSILSVVACLTLAASINAADEKVYATVDGEKITKDDVAVVLRDPRINFETLPKNAQEQVLGQVIEKTLLTKQAVNSDVDKLPEYKEALEKIKKDLALEVWMQQEFKKITATDDELKNFYDKNLEKFKIKDTYEARHILVTTEKEAKDIIEELKKAKDVHATFVELAKNKSTGPTGKDGGYLGKFTADQMVPEFSKAASELKAGSFTKTPVKTQFGYHVIFLESKEAAKTLKFDEVKAKIKQVVIQTKFKEKIKSVAQSLKSKAKIEMK